MMSLLRLALLVVLLAPAIGHAQNDGGNSQPKRKSAGPKKESLHDQFTGQGYGLAGCGLGSVVFGPKPGMIQVAAAITNNYFFPQTFAISSGTSNCDIPEMGMQAARFIEVNKEILAKDAARGDGETVVGLASLLHCSDLPAFKQKLRDNFESVLQQDTDSYEKARRVLKMIENDQQLTQTCAQLS